MMYLWFQRAILLARISHAPVRNAHRVPRFRSRQEHTFCGERAVRFAPSRPARSLNDHSNESTPYITGAKCPTGGCDLLIMNEIGSSSGKALAIGVTGVSGFGKSQVGPEVAKRLG